MKKAIKKYEAIYHVPFSFISQYYDSGLERLVMRTPYEPLYFKPRFLPGEVVAIAQSYSAILDELEPGASTNLRRIEAMRQLHRAGFRTFASLEPVVVPAKTAKMARMAADYCDLYKVGLQSGVPKSYYAEEDIFEMVYEIDGTGVRTYYKHSLTAFLNREEQKPVDIFSIGRGEK